MFTYMQLVKSGYFNTNNKEKSRYFNFLYLHSRKINIFKKFIKKQF